MSADEFEDLLGPKPKNKGGRPSKDDIANRPEDPVKAMAEAEPIELATHRADSAINMKGAMGGVTVYWLSQVFGIAADTVRKRLADVPPYQIHGRAPRYRIKDVAPYLVTPKVDIDQVIQNMKSTDLPPLLQKDVWDAKLKRQKWELEAGELWKTEDVIAVLSDVFSIIKSTIQLWPDTVERSVGMEEEQRQLLIQMGDSLQDEIYRRLCELAKQKSTKAVIADIEAEERSEEDDDELENLL